MSSKRINSKRKGKGGELEVAHLFEAFGFPARRGQQYKGTPDSPDVEIPEVEGLYVEVKRVEKGLNLFRTLDKADTEKPAGTDSIVFHRINREPWLVTLRAEAFLKRLFEARWGDG